MNARAVPGGRAHPRILVLGYGNPGRQDDGLGPAVAQAIGELGWPGVTTWENDQLALEDAIEVAAHDVVWFVDAAREGPDPFAATRLRPALDFTFTSHILAPQTLLAITRQQFAVEPEAHLLAVRGHAFEFEEGLSPQAQANFEHALTFLSGRIAAVRQEAS